MQDVQHIELAMDYWHLVAIGGVQLALIQNEGQYEEDRFCVQDFVGVDLPYLSLGEVDYIGVSLLF